jgi:DNA mismatch repair protein MutS
VPAPTFLSQLQRIPLGTRCDLCLQVAAGDAAGYPSQLFQISDHAPEGSSHLPGFVVASHDHVLSHVSVGDLAGSLDHDPQVGRDGAGHDQAHDQADDERQPGKSQHQAARLGKAGGAVLPGGGHISRYLFSRFFQLARAVKLCYDRATGLPPARPTSERSIHVFQSTEPLASELAKEARNLRQKLGARQLRNAGQEHPAEAENQAGISAQVEAGQAAPVQGISLLWPRDRDCTSTLLYEDSIRDLDLENVAMALAAGVGKEQRDYVTNVLCQLCHDPDVIRYRQDIVADLLHHPQLAVGLQDLLPQFENLGTESMPSRQTTELFQIAWWLGTLETYVECIQRTAELFRQVEDELQSEGLRQMRDQIAAIEKDAVFESLVRELPGMLSRIRGVVSITVGINLDPDLHPESATLLAVNDQKFSEAPLLKVLLGNVDEYQSVMPLHTVPAIRSGRGAGQPNPMLIPLFRDLSRVMEEVTKPIARALRRYVDLEYSFLAGLRPELAFYVGAANLIERIEAGGLPMCRPEWVPAEQRVTEAQDSYNLNLALHLLDAEGPAGPKEHMVQNHVTLGSEGRIVVLTGPNQGGKTTYVQGIGLLQVLAQVGLYVPGTEARISPADNVFTHFPVEEELSEGTGRFGDEARRLGDIFQEATPASLILLNEALSGTYAGESLYLARDVLQILRMLGVRAIYATHMHELAAGVDELNAATSGDSAIVSMVSSRIDPRAVGQAPAHEPPQAAVERSYRVVESPPMGRSYARELAMLYGISFEQLVELLDERGLLDGAPGSPERAPQAPGTGTP